MFSLGINVPGAIPVVAGVSHFTAGAVDKDVARVARADEGPLSVPAEVIAPATAVLTLVHVCAREAVGAEDVACVAGAGEAGLGVDTLLLTPADSHQALVHILASLAVGLEAEARMTATDGTVFTVVTLVMTSTVVGEAGVHRFYLVTGLAIGGQLVAGVTQALVGTPGVAAPLAAHSWSLTLILIVAGDLVVVQVVPPPAGAADPPLLSPALVVTPAVVDGTRVSRQAAPVVLRQVVPWPAGADDATPG